MKTCTIEGCSGAVRSRGLCPMHLSRWYRHGDAGAAGRVRHTPGGRCQADGCVAIGTRQQLCTLHYQRLRRWASTADRPSEYVGGWVLSDVERAYMAGFIDGEGTIGMKRERRVSRHGDTYVPYVSVGNTDPQVVEWLHRTFGGTFRKRTTPPRGNAKPFVWVWTAGARLSLAVCKELLPFLRMKRPQAELLIDVYRGRRRFRRTSQTAPPEYFERLDQAWRTLRAMNWRGVAPDEQSREETAAPAS